MAQQPVENQRFESFPELRETPEEIAFELRAQEGALWTGSRLLIGIFAFGFAALAFAYFYLRSANNEDLWRPGGITAPTDIGAAIFAVAVASALLVQFGERRFRINETLDWQVAGWTAVAGGLLAVGLQIFLPGFKRLRLVLHRVGGVEHPAHIERDVLDRDDPRPRAAPAQSNGARRRRTEFDFAGGASAPRQLERLHLFLGFHRAGGDALLATLLCHLSWEEGVHDYC
jgi:MFS family permease